MLHFRKNRRSDKSCEVRPEVPDEASINAIVDLVVKAERTSGSRISFENVHPDSLTPYSDATKIPGQHETGRVKRPLNTFMVFAHYMRSRVLLVNDKLNNAFVSKRLGELWKMFSPEEKQPFVDEANRLKALHAKQYPDYRYQPRRRVDCGDSQQLSQCKSETGSGCSSSGALSPKPHTINRRNHLSKQTCRKRKASKSWCSSSSVESVCVPSATPSSTSEWDCSPIGRQSCGRRKREESESETRHSMPLIDSSGPPQPLVPCSAGTGWHSDPVSVLGYAHVPLAANHTMLDFNGFYNQYSGTSDTLLADRHVHSYNSRQPFASAQVSQRQTNQAGTLLGHNACSLLAASVPAPPNASGYSLLVSSDHAEPHVLVPASWLTNAAPCAFANSSNRVFMLIPSTASTSQEPPAFANVQTPQACSTSHSQLTAYSTQTAAADVNNNDDSINNYCSRGRYPPSADNSFLVGDCLGQTQSAVSNTLRVKQHDGCKMKSLTDSGLQLDSQCGMTGGLTSSVNSDAAAAWSFDLFDDVSFVCDTPRLPVGPSDVDAY